MSIATELLEQIPDDDPTYTDRYECHLRAGWHPAIAAVQAHKDLTPGASMPDDEPTQRPTDEELRAEWRRLRAELQTHGAHHHNPRVRRAIRMIDVRYGGPA